MFDTSDPPKTYKKFRKAVIQAVEGLEIEEEENFPAALFIVSRDGKADIQYVEEIVEENEEVEVNMIIMSIFPSFVKMNNSKFFALVLPGTYTEPNGEEQEIVTMLSGSMEDTELMIAEIDRSDYEAELEPWEKQNIMNFSNLIVPYRRAITPQG
jgi:hypothetical protein